MIQPMYDSAQNVLRPFHCTLVLTLLLLALYHAGSYQLRSYLACRHSETFYRRCGPFLVLIFLAAVCNVP